MVFMPLWDHNPFKWPTPPYVMWGIVVINFAIFFVQAGGNTIDQADHYAGLIPAVFIGGYIPGTLPGPVTIITSMFLHANFMHVFGNMLFLFVFGDDIEEVLGHVRFFIFYFACGIAAALAFVLSDPHSTTELVGASGAVAGVISAYLIFRPCEKVTCLLGLIPLRLRAYWVIGSWAVWQVVEAAMRDQDGVAYWAHVGGLIAGAALFVLMRPAGVRLFECVQAEDVASLADARPPR